MKTGGSVEPPFVVGENQTFNNSNEVWTYKSGQSFTKKNNTNEYGCWIHPGKAIIKTSTDHGFYFAGSNTRLEPDRTERTLWGVNVFGSYSSIYSPKRTTSTGQEYDFSLRGVSIFGRSGVVGCERGWPDYGEETKTTEDETGIIINPKGREDLDYIDVDEDKNPKLRYMGLWSAGVNIMASGGLFSNDKHDGVAVLGSFCHADLPINNGVVIMGVSEYPEVRKFKPDAHNIAETGGTITKEFTSHVSGAGIFIRGTQAFLQKNPDTGSTYGTQEPSLIQVSDRKSLKTQLAGHLQLTKDCTIYDVDGNKIIENGRLLKS